MFSIKSYDLAVIGSGPTGLFSGYFASLHGLSVIIFEALANPGGQPQMLYPAKAIKDVPGFDSITGLELTKRLLEEIEKGQVVLKCHHRVNHLVKTENKQFLIDDQFLAQSIIIATGTGAFKPKPLPLSIPERAVAHIHYSLPDLTPFQDKMVAVFGGGDSALDFALSLAQVAKVTLIHRRNQFRGFASSIEKLASLKNVTLLTPYLPQKIDFENGQLTIHLSEVAGKQEKSLSVDEVLVAYGFRADNRFVQKWGIGLSGRLISTNRLMQTNIPGIYAVGDAVTYDGRVPVIGLGFGESQIAITNLMRLQFTKKKLTIHSTAL